MSDCRLILGDCTSVLPTLPVASVDAVVTDPPAGISFMGATWDSFGGRGNENAERDRAAGNRSPGAGRGNQPFGYSGSTLGTPKQRAAFTAFLTAVMAECLRVVKPGAYALVWAIPRTSHWTATAVEDAGWVITDRIAHLFGSGFPKHKSKLKPAVEDWWLCWKPARQATPLNIDGCRIACEPISTVNGSAECPGWRMHKRQGKEFVNTTGRWPANLVLSHAECNGTCHEDCPVRLLDEQSGASKSRAGWRNNHNQGHEGWSGGTIRSGPLYSGHADAGGASRFFYCAKASRKDRGAGNTHPTVKPHELMRWLCRLVTPPGGMVLDPFAGSGSTALACFAEDLGFVGIEKDPAYHAIAEKRIAAARSETPLFAEVPE